MWIFPWILTLLTFLLYVRQIRVQCETQCKALCKTQLILAISLYHPLTQKGSFTYIYGLAIYVTEWLPFACDVSLENSADSYFFLTGFTSLSVLLHFPLSRSSSLCTVFDGILYNMDKVLLINPSTNVFAFGEFSIHHRDWLTFSGGTGKPGELWYYFFISNDLAEMVNFPIRNSGCDSHSQY